MSTTTEGFAEADPPSGTDGNGDDATLGGGSGGLFNEPTGDAVRKLGRFTVDLAEAIGQSNAAERARLQSLTDQIVGFNGFEAVAQAVEQTPPSELHPVGLGDEAGAAKLAGLMDALNDFRDELAVAEREDFDVSFARPGLNKEARRSLRWGKFFWGSLRQIIGVFFPRLKNLMEAVSELFDYLDNVLQEFPEIESADS